MLLVTLMDVRLLLCLAIAGCTTVVQEPADLDDADVHELRIVQGDTTNVRIVSDAGWLDAGASVFVENRLTGDLVSAETGSDGALDVTIAGTIGDVFSISRVADPTVVRSITTRETATIPAFGWGFGGPSGCEAGEFAVGVVHPPADGHEHEACFAHSEPTQFGDQAVHAVGTDALALVTGTAPRLRLRARLAHLATLHVQLVTEDAHGTSHTFGATTDLHPEEFGFWVDRPFDAEHLTEAGGQPLYPDLTVSGLWVWTNGDVDVGLEVDDVVLEAVEPAE